ncbi:MAG: hypothetical protein ACO33A_02075 [Hyphomonas sp.]
MICAHLSPDSLGLSGARQHSMMGAVSFPDRKGQCPELRRRAVQASPGQVVVTS